VAVIRPAEPVRLTIAECIALAEAHERETGLAAVPDLERTGAKGISRQGSMGGRPRGLGGSNGGSEGVTQGAFVSPGGAPVQRQRDAAPCGPACSDVDV
jgi:hypothetical protein